MKNALVGLAVLVVLIVGAWYVLNNKPDIGIPTQTTTVSYVCPTGLTVAATYYSGATQPIAPAGEPPVPTGSVHVLFSNGRETTLAQTISASGARYANSDESLVFWNKGNGVMITENNQHINCVTVVPAAGSATEVYVEEVGLFSLRYPKNWTVDPNYNYQALGPTSTIMGTKFTIDPAIATGTNLSPDTYLSVETIPNTTACSASLFVAQATSTTMTDSGVEYSVATSSDAAAGNRYDEVVYARATMNSCVGIRYFVHYGVLQNYPEGTVQEFDRAVLMNTFDSVRRTITINQ